VAKAYIHLESLETLSEYNAKISDWKHKIYELFDEMRLYHESLEVNQEWYGFSHDEFYEEHILMLYKKFLQPAAQYLDEESSQKLRDLRVRAEELGIG
tara:strand:+ start:3788 stop:4081 length:294 start_codon:yes stop_codon:yes gene_type:complete